jgi:SWI/SNF-related matrix-associated actin-dependent regulator 1 of chromatin subfamily A
MNAGKVKWLQENLPSMREAGDRVLLFSQFTMVLELLETVLNAMGVRYLKLTGQTNVAERQGMVDEYYADPDITVFLLSTRAGGLGLNLAAANVVIIYDLDFVRLLALRTGSISLCVKEPA